MYDFLHLMSLSAADRDCSPDIHMNAYSIDNRKYNWQKPSAQKIKIYLK